MKAEIAYVANKKLIDINSFSNKNSKNTSEFKNTLSSLLRKKIIENGFFHSSVKIIEDENHNISNVLVDNCIPNSINNIKVININLNSKINLDAVTRDINYMYKSKQINHSTIKNIMDDLYDKAIKLCLIVKDIQVIVEIDRERKDEVNLICILDLVDASTNYVLNVKLNADFFAKNTKEDLSRIYDKFIFDTDNLSFYNLNDALSKYINQHSYIKKINIYCSEKDEKQIMDFLIYISLLSNLTIKSINFFDTKYDNNIKTHNMFVMDGNLVNKLYFRLFLQPFEYYNGLCFRFKKQMGYKRLFYIGINYYLHNLYSVSDVNFIIKLKQQINEKSILIGRLSLRYFFKLHNINIGIVIGHKTTNLDIRVLFLELYLIKLFRTGLSIYYNMHSNFLKSINLFIGLATISSLPKKYNINSIYFKSVPLLCFDAKMNNLFFELKMIMDDISINDINKISCDSSIYYIFKYSSHIFRIGFSLLKDYNRLRYRPAISINLI